MLAGKVVTSLQAVKDASGCGNSTWNWIVLLLTRVVCNCSYNFSPYFSTRQATINDARKEDVATHVWDSGKLIETAKGLRIIYTQTDPVS